MSEDNYVKAAESTTNTTEGSQKLVELDLTPICQNMTNKEFRALIAKLRDAALPMIRDRIRGLARWDQGEQDRVKAWFGRADQSTRGVLATGLPKLLGVMQNLNPENVIRWDEQKQRNVTCTIFPDNGISDAAVCKPDSARHIIAIYPYFCTLPDAELWQACRMKVLIHECTHFTDTFNSDDVMYGQGTGMRYWAPTDPDGAIRNADSIACYVAHFDKKLW